MDVKKLNTINKIMQSAGVDEITIEHEDTVLTLLRSKDGQIEAQADDVAASAQAGSPPVAKTQTQKQVLASEEKSEDGASVEGEVASQTFDVLSPEIGYFSRFNPKTRKQFVKLRDRVKPGDVIATVKSMHVDHHVKADRAGKIIDLLVEETQPVEYGQPLFRLQEER